MGLRPSSSFSAGIDAPCPRKGRKGGLGRNGMIRYPPTTPQGFPGEEFAREPFR